ncbi:MAG: hypothetical protein V1808_01455 [Candidatus Daviesbacteria bacterium]
MISTTVVQLVAYIVAYFILGQLPLPIYLVTIVVIVDLLLTIYSFRFQRTTLSIARNMGAQGINNQGNIQILLTPNYLGYISFINTIIGASAFVLIGFNIGWIYSIGYLLIKWFGTGIIDIFIPIPSYSYCLNLIEKHLNNEVKSKKNIELLAFSIQLLAEIDEARRKLKEGTFKG